MMSGLLSSGLLSEWPSVRWPFVGVLLSVGLLSKWPFVLEPQSTRSTEKCTGNIQWIKDLRMIDTNYSSTRKLVITVITSIRHSHPLHHTQTAEKSSHHQVCSGLVPSSLGILCCRLCRPPCMHHLNWDSKNNPVCSDPATLNTHRKRSTSQSV